VSQRPNILFIMADQMRRDALGCYGNPVVQTPNLDALARRGVRFEQMYAAYPVCAPNRASIITGRYPTVHRLRANGMRWKRFQQKGR
jgi:arylsulfatase A-like enzyme